MVRDHKGLLWIALGKESIEWIGITLRSILTIMFTSSWKMLNKTFGLSPPKVYYATIQTKIHIGVTTGTLPTKGLTLPLVSYGGSSVVIVCISLGILARIDAESRYLAKREGIIK